MKCKPLIKTKWRGRDVVENIAPTP